MENSTENRLLTAWIRASRTIATQLECHLYPIGINSTEFEILRALQEDRNLRIADLGDATVLTTSGSSRAIVNLEKQGLVKRENCGNDGRAAIVNITAQGVTKLAQAQQAAAPVIKKLLEDNLSPRERTVLTRLCHSIADSKN